MDSRALAIALLLAGCADPAAPDAAGTARPAVTPVHAVQGRSDTSPLVGESLTVRGIVSGDFQDDDADDARNLGGFFLQSDRPDDDPATSEGLFVFDRNLDKRPDVSRGDQVSVAGTVVERFGETQLVATQVERRGNAAPRVTELALPAAAAARNSDGLPIADLERYEGMLVSVPQPLYIADLATLERFGDLPLSTAQRTYVFTNRHAPSVAGFTAWQEQQAVQTLVLDDGQVRQNVRPIAYLRHGAVSGRWSPRIGDQVDSLLGVLRFSRGSGAAGVETWRLMPVSDPVFSRRNERSAAPAFDSVVTVASLNVLNYFATVDRGDAVCGPAGASGCRGADSEQELRRQRDKIVATVAGLDADVIGLMEIENGASIPELVRAFNVAMPGDRWSAVETGPLGDDAIRVALVYRAASVALVGRFAVLDGQVDGRYDADKNRPAIAQTFRSTANGGTLTVAVIHFKSKGSPCDDVGDPDRDDGQGNCNRTRRDAAAALADWLAGDPTGSGDPDYLVIGDANAYPAEDPVTALAAAGLVNLLAKFVGEEAYSFVFRGQAGALDHAFASPSLAAQVSGAAEWHSNADEPPLFDYNLEFGRDPNLFDPASPWRASDHDPLVIGLALDPD